MRGVILGVHDGRGVLTADDQRRLEFPMSEWRSTLQPVAGDKVDFIEAEGEARAVYRVIDNVSSAIVVGTPRSTFLGAVALACLAFGIIVPIILPTIAAFILGVIGAGEARPANDSGGLLMARIAWIGALVQMGLGIILILVFLIFGVAILQAFAAWLALAGYHWDPHSISLFYKS